MPTTIEILNLKCGGCATTVKNGMLSIEGISEVKVDLERSEVTIDSKNEMVVLSAKEKLSKMGYPEIGDVNTMLHKAKSFVSCASGRIKN